MTEGLPASLHAALADLTRWLRNERIRAIIIGGVAVSLLGRPRLTQDIDALAMVPETDWDSLVRGAAGYGIVGRIDGALEFAHRSRVLLMRHEPSGIDVDLTLGGLAFEDEAVQRGCAHDVGGLQVPLPRVEDLLVMKAVARRPQDVEDIRALLNANPGADVAAARRWVREFATAMSMPDLLDDFDRLIVQR